MELRLSLSPFSFSLAMELEKTREIRSGAVEADRFTNSPGSIESDPLGRADRFQDGLIDRCLTAIVAKLSSPQFTIP